MNVFSKDYNIFLSKGQNIIPTDYESRYDILDNLWSVVCQTLNRL